ncbi:hypothetical protein BANRA_03959 [Acinetobacter baumannii]|nr:hypothetical protein BANRA_03959 [Acinetobacter baumannii]
MCFIKAAMNSKLPLSEEKLFEWSDEIRRTAKCRISKNALNFEGILFNSFRSLT